MLQHCASLLDRNALEPIDKLVDRGIVFEVFKECCDRHASATEDPCATKDGGVLFHGRAS